MRHLRMLGLMLLGVIALGSFAAASASATEVGILTLSGTSEKVEVKAGAATNPELVAGTSTIKCAKLKEVTTSATGAHILLFNEVVLTFEGCKEGELGCRSENLKAEKDPVETILALVDFHLVALLSGTTLLQGLAAIILDQSEPKATEKPELKIKCGTGNVLVKGAAKGLVEGTSLTADVKTGTFKFAKVALKCDSADKLCVELEEKLPFQANFKGTFEEAAQITTSAVTLNKEVLFDY